MPARVVTRLDPWERALEMAEAEAEAEYKMDGGMPDHTCRSNGLRPHDLKCRACQWIAARAEHLMWNMADGPEREPEDRGDR